MHAVIDVSGNADYAKDIFEVEKECFPGEFWSFKLIEGELSHKNSLYFVIEFSGKTAAYLNMSLAYDTAEINRVAVKKAFRRRLAADALITYAINHVKSLGYKKVLLEVRSTNVAAANLYYKNGFKTDAIRKNYYQNPSDDAILMSLEL